MRFAHRELPLVGGNRLSFPMPKGRGLPPVLLSMAVSVGLTWWSWHRELQRMRRWQAIEQEQMRTWQHREQEQFRQWQAAWQRLADAQEESL